MAKFKVGEYIWYGDVDHVYRIVRVPDEYSRMIYTGCAFYVYVRAFTSDTDATRFHWYADSITVEWRMRLADIGEITALLALHEEDNQTPKGQG